MFGITNKRALLSFPIIISLSSEHGFNPQGRGFFVVHGRQDLRARNVNAARQHTSLGFALSFPSIYRRYGVTRAQGSWHPRRHVLLRSRAELHSRWACNLKGLLYSDFMYVNMLVR